MTEASGEADQNLLKNPKLALLRRIKEQKGQTNEDNQNAKTIKPKDNIIDVSADSESCFPKNSKKKQNEKIWKTKSDANMKMPHVSGVFLDEYEKSIKISENDMLAGNSASYFGNESVPSSISLNDIKNYIDDLAKPTGLVSLSKKEQYLKYRLLLIQELSQSHSRNLLTGKHTYNIGIASLIPKTKCDIYEAATQLIDDFYMCLEKDKMRSILMDFLTFFANVLTSKDVGMTTYVIEQSIKTGVLERLIKICSSWTMKDSNMSDISDCHEAYPDDITTQIEEYFKDKEDQLTASWMQLIEKDATKYILPVFERCLRSTVRFGESMDIELYELSVLDYSASGIQPNSSEGKVHPLNAILAEKFPGYFDKYKSFHTDKDNDKLFDKQMPASTKNGLVSLHRLFSNGFALVSLGMRRRKYLEKLDQISESVAEVLASHPNDDFGTISMYSPCDKYSSSEDLPDLESLKVEDMKVQSSKNSERIIKNKSCISNMFIVMTEDLHFESSNNENQQNAPKYLAQIDFLRAVLLKPKNIYDTYRSLKLNGKIRKQHQWAYVYLVDVGIIAQVKVTSLLVIKDKSILAKDPLLSFVKIKELDPSIDLGIANACARVIYHIVDDLDTHRHMTRYVIKGERIQPPSIASWRRLLVEKNYFLGLQALSIKAFRCISQEHHDKNCSNLDEMPVNDSEFHTDMCKYIGEFLLKLLYIKTYGSEFEKITQDRSIDDAMHTLYYTMDIMPEARLKRTLDESKINQVVQVMLDPEKIISNDKTTNKLSDLVERQKRHMRRQLDDIVLSLAEKIYGFETGGNALMRRITNQRLTGNCQQGLRRPAVRGNNFIEMGVRPNKNRASIRGNTGNAESKRRPMPSESEGGPIHTGGGIVPNSRSQAHQIAIKAGIPGFNQPIYRSKADIDPEVRYSTVGQSGVSTKAIAYRTAEDKYIEDLENAPANCAIVMKERTPIVDRAKELERIQQDEDPIDYESLITYADIADFAIPENVVALADMKSSRRFKQEIVALLNETRGGQILMGVDERLNGGAGLVSGVFLSRFLKDKFRQEMDGIPKQIAPDPLPDRRIGQPVFIPVRYNPRGATRSGETPYVIRIAIRPKIKDHLTKSGGDSGANNQIYYKLRDEPNPMIRFNGKTVEGTFLNIQKKILQTDN